MFSDALVMPSSTGSASAGSTAFGHDLLVGFLEHRPLDQITGQHSVSPEVVTMHLAQHLADDHLKMLVVDVLTLRTVHLLHFAQQILRHRVAAQDFQDAMRVLATLRSAARPAVDRLTVTDQQAHAGRNFVIAFIQAFPDDAHALFIAPHATAMPWQPSLRRHVRQ